MRGFTTIAQSWIADWNAHDVDKILRHYAPNVEFHSPRVAKFTKGAETHFSSREALKPYFSFAFQIRPNLHFELRSVCIDANGVAVVYNDELGASVVELMEVDEMGQAVFVRVLYDK
jgi:hypothetical protein